MAVMVGTDFFTVEVLTLKGLKTFYVLFFIHLESRRICLAGVTGHPDQEWMEQMARNITMEETGFFGGQKIFTSRPRQQVWFIVLPANRSGEGEGPGSAAQKSQPERVRGTLG